MSRAVIKTELSEFLRSPTEHLERLNESGAAASLTVGDQRKGIVMSFRAYYAMVEKD